MSSARPAARWWLAAGLVALLGLVPQFLSRTIPDVAFPLWAAGRVLDGARLYVDILEINPPLFIWLDVPLVWVARLTGLDPILVFRLAVTLLFGGSLLGVRHFMRRAALVPTERTRRLLLLAAVFALGVLPRLDWGEREHLSLALVLPWLLLGAARIATYQPSKREMWGAGLMAGMGIALKPHFVLLWIAREIVVQGGRGGRGGRGEGGPRLSSLVSLESAVAAGFCTLYLVGAIVFTPEYFGLLRQLAAPYSRFIHVTVLESLVGPAPALALASVALAIGLRRVEGARPLRRVLLAGVLAYAVAALLQSKGFRYHWYPAMALSFVMLVTFACLAWRVKKGGAVLFFKSVTVAAVAVTVALTGWDALRQALTPLSPEWDADPSIGLLLPVLQADGARGETLAVLSTNMASGFPLTSYAGTKWPLRFSNLWPAISEYRDALARGISPELRTADRMTPVERHVVGATVVDLLRARPSRLLMLRQLTIPSAAYTTRMDVRSFLGRDARFAPFLASYDSAGTVGMYTYWRRRGPESSGRQEFWDVNWPQAAAAAGGLTLADGAASGAIIFLAVLIAVLIRAAQSPDSGRR